MLRTIELHGFGQTNDFGISSVRGYLSVYDNLLKLFVMFFTVFLFQGMLRRFLPFCKTLNYKKSREIFFLAWIEIQRIR